MVKQKYPIGTLVRYNLWNEIGLIVSYKERTYRLGHVYEIWLSKDISIPSQVETEKELEDYYSILL